MKNDCWANILCKPGQLPYMVIVSDGEHTDKIPCSNTPVEKLKRSIRELYNLSPDHILVSTIQPDEGA